MNVRTLLLAGLAGTIAGVPLLAPSRTAHAAVTSVKLVACRRVEALAPDACKGKASLPVGQIINIADNLGDKDGVLEASDLDEVVATPATLDETATNPSDSLLVFAFVDQISPVTFASSSNQVAFVASDSASWLCAARADDDCGGEFPDGVVTANLINRTARVGETITITVGEAQARITIAGVGVGPGVSTATPPPTAPPSATATRTRVIPTSTARMAPTPTATIVPPIPSDGMDWTRVAEVVGGLAVVAGVAGSGVVIARRVQRGTKPKDARGAGAEPTLHGAIDATGSQEIEANEHGIVTLRAVLGQPKHIELIEEEQRDDDTR